jgi:hypothetical protein
LVWIISVKVLGWRANSAQPICDTGRANNRPDHTLELAARQMNQLIALLAALQRGVTTAVRALPIILIGIEEDGGSRPKKTNGIDQVVSLDRLQRPRGGDQRAANLGALVGLENEYGDIPGLVLVKLRKGLFELVGSKEASTYARFDRDNGLDGREHGTESGRLVGKYRTKATRPLQHVGATEHKRD